MVFKKVRNVDPKMIVLSNPYLEEEPVKEEDTAVIITKKHKKITLQK